MKQKIIPWEVDVNSFSDKYVAGFWDGDGSIVATVEKRPERRRFPYRVRLKIVFTQHSRHKKIIVLLWEFLGKAGHIWDVSSHNLVELVIQDRTEVTRILKRIRPHLIIKKRQALLMEDILKIYEKSKVNTRSSLFESEYASVLSLVKEIRRLNSNTGGKIILK